MIGLAHAGLNVTALGLFAAVIGVYVTDWNGRTAPRYGAWPATRESVSWLRTRNPVATARRNRCPGH